MSDLTFWGPWFPICKMETTVDALRLALNKCTVPGKQQVCYQNSHGPKVPVAGLQGTFCRHLLLGVPRAEMSLSVASHILLWELGTSWVQNRSLLFSSCLMDSSGGSDSKESACNSGDLGSIPGLGRSPEKGNGSPLQYSCLENYMDRGAWWVTVHGVTKCWIQLSDLYFSF